MVRTNKETLYPEDYLKAGGELLVVLFAVAWGMTWLVHPEVIGDNPIRDVVGYNNLCVGFDMPPATYAGAFIYCGVLYFCVRYAWTSVERNALMKDQLTEGQRRFSLVANILYMLSIGAFGLVFVISPYVSLVGHFLAFVQLILARFLVVWANVYTSPMPSRGTVRFVWVYGLISVALPTIAVSSLIHATSFPGGPAAAEPLFPYQLTMAVDYSWFVCLALTTKFLPRGRPLLIQTSLGAHA